MSSIPSLPPLSSIDDKNTRSFFQAIVDQLNVRNGQVGNGDEKFITVSDLVSGLSGSTALVSGASSAVSASVSSAIQDSAAALIQKVSDEVLQSREWKDLAETIVRIDTPEWFRGKFGSAIKTEQTIRSTADNAIAQQLTTLVANINGNLALAQQDLEVLSDTAGATASAVTQLQTQVGSVDAAAQEALTLATSADGAVKGTWSIKFDVNGYVAGVEFGVTKHTAGPPKSTFVVRADVFAVGAPGATDTLPFVVTNNTVYMNSAVIKDASIDTLKVAGNAITVPQYAAFYSGTIASGVDVSDTGTFPLTDGTTIGSITAPAGDKVNNLLIVTGRTGIITDGNAANIHRRIVVESSQGFRVFDTGWSPFLGDTISFALFHGPVYNTAVTFTIRAMSRYATANTTMSMRLGVTLMGAKR